LPADTDLDGTIGVQGKLAKLKENDKKLKELAAWEKADATVGTVCTASASPYIHSISPQAQLTEVT